MVLHLVHNRQLGHCQWWSCAIWHTQGWFSWRFSLQKYFVLLACSQTSLTSTQYLLLRDRYYYAPMHTFLWHRLEYHLRLLLSLASVPPSTRRWPHWAFCRSCRRLHGGRWSHLVVKESRAEGTELWRRGLLREASTSSSLLNIRVKGGWIRSKRLVRVIIF